MLREIVYRDLNTIQNYKQWFSISDQFRQCHLVTKYSDLSSLAHIVFHYKLKISGTFFTTVRPCFVSFVFVPTPQTDDV